MTVTRTLVVMRHAKSSWPDGVTDEQRPVSPRGLRDAAKAGQWFSEHLPPFDQVLCSSAKRTRETWDQITAHGAEAAHVSYLDEIYESDPSTMQALVNALPREATTVLVLGHQPTVEQFTVNCIQSDEWGQRPSPMVLGDGFVTSAFAVLDVDDSWSRLQPGTAKLRTFHIPRADATPTQ